MDSDTDILVVGAGPAGASAAAWAARRGRSVVLADAARFPRDKTCGDGLTPRAIAELDQLGMGEWLRSRVLNKGVRIRGFGRERLAPWPSGSYPALGSAVPRAELDDRVRQAAVASGAEMIEGARAVDATLEEGRVTAVSFDTGHGSHRIRCRTLVVADGVRSPLGRRLGRVWHRDTVYGVAARAYVKTPRSEDPWITVQFEMRDHDRSLLPGYGWVFPLGSGEVNVGVGSLATAKRPSRVALRPLLERYTEDLRPEWGFEGDVRAVTSALIPMGGAVSGIAGRNWALIGDAAGCVYPLNGEGIDYGLEGGRLVAEMLDEPDLTDAWPAILRDRYGLAFSLARRIAGIATVPGMWHAGRPTIHYQRVVDVMLRLMGNLVTEEDRDVAARLWRVSGRASIHLDSRPPFS
ncbi:geranylgeranyl reductase family protein [Nocardia sp. NPDC046763]|uniref:geranylgeranyl reductase family protein n=1 Tax=Nocardia sp. NPDC046763 TaxID=3155256 RepID=UPI0033C39AF2